jgi:hypothetical protein
MSVEVGVEVAAVDRISNRTFIKFALHFPRDSSTAALTILFMIS